MNRTDFAIFLNKYLTDYMVNDRGCSAKTIDSYRYAFINLLQYYSEEESIDADKVTLSDLTYENIIRFLEWLQEHQHNSISSRNQKQSAINSFIRYLSYVKPEYMPEYQRILGIPIKKVPQKEISYLKEDGVKLLMEQIPLHNTNGLRDYIIL
ncbi:tyrosine-type recombinase/integrase, partial [Butyrivibrio sp. LC3010]|uniref:tyrosine-type recombinase/integrase n=1 Tax=Butyrivibrio sp. LC3010 TaxID=1280680 RepID=UPI000478F591